MSIIDQIPTIKKETIKKIADSSTKIFDLHINGFEQYIFIFVTGTYHRKGKHWYYGIPNIQGKKVAYTGSASFKKMIREHIKELLLSEDERQEILLELIENCQLVKIIRNPHASPFYNPDMSNITVIDEKWVEINDFLVKITKMSNNEWYSPFKIKGKYFICRKKKKRLISQIKNCLGGGIWRDQIEALTKKGDIIPSQHIESKST